jgi:hypothetical protein
MRCGYPRSDTSRLIFGELERTKPRAPEGLAHAAEHPPKADSFYPALFIQFISGRLRAPESAVESGC